MSMTSVKVFIQARMSSSRYPGKVLAPLAGRPVLARVVDQVAAAVPREHIVVLTSREESDDPLAAYVPTLGVALLRGPLEDVFSRFQLCLKAHPCRWFIRISADSPLLDASLFERFMACQERDDLDLVTNVLKRTFPHGHSLEMVRAATFAALPADRLTDEEKEHVTKVFYNHPADYRILNIESGNPALGQVSYTVDTLEDLKRLEALIEPQFSRKG